MKLLFKNKTQYTKKNYQKYLEFHQAKYGSMYQFYTILTIILLVFCIISNIKYRNYILSIIFIITLILFCFIRFKYPSKKIKKELKTEKFDKEQTFTFYFYEKYFTISDGKNKNEIKYLHLYKIFETNDFFYLYINKNHAFLLEKTKFIKGNSEEFISFLKKKCWFKVK